MRLQQASPAASAAMYDQLRQALKDSNDSRWMLSNDELSNLFQISPLTVPAVSSAIRDITLTELTQIVLTRKRFPSYRSDLYIPDEIVQAVEQFATDQDGSLVIPPSQPDNIPDNLAVQALTDRNQNLTVPLTFSPSQNLMRRKMSYPMVPSGFSAYTGFGSYPRSVAGLSGPMVLNSLRQLNAFSAFSDDATGDPSAVAQPADSSSIYAGLTDQQIADANVPASPADVTGSSTGSYNASSGAGSGANAGAGSTFGSLFAALPSLVTAGTSVYNSVQGPAKPASITLNAAGQPVIKPVASGGNTTLLLLVGAAVVVFLMMNKKGGSRR